MVEGGFEGKGEMKDNCREKGSWEMEAERWWKDMVMCYSSTKSTRHTHTVHSTQTPANLQLA